MGVASADHQREHRKFQLVIASLPLFQQHGVDVSFEMIDGDERLGSGERQRFGKAETYQQRSCQPGSLSYSDRVYRVVALARRRPVPCVTTGTIARRCSREASSGTTPP